MQETTREEVKDEAPVARAEATRDKRLLRSRNPSKRRRVAVGRRGQTDRRKSPKPSRRRTRALRKRDKRLGAARGDQKLTEENKAKDEQLLRLRGTWWTPNGVGRCSGSARPCRVRSSRGASSNSSGISWSEAEVRKGSPAGSFSSAGRN